MMIDLIKQSIKAGTVGGIAMIPVGLLLRYGLGHAVNVYGELVVLMLFGRLLPWAIMLEHMLISWGMAFPLVALALRLPANNTAARRLTLGLLYGAAIWAMINSLLLPLLFGRPTAWQLGWLAIWPSLLVHLVYGVAAAATLGRRQAAMRTGDM